MQTALGLAEDYLNLAQRAQDPLLLGGPLVTGRLPRSILEKLTLAHTYIEQGIALDDQLQYRSQLFLREDPGRHVSCRSGACSLWLLGYPEQALERSPRGR